MKMVALGEVVTIRGGGTPDKSVSAYWNGNIPWASVKDFKDTVLANTIDSITEAGVAASATQIIPAGNIIVPTRMAVGKVAINTIDLAINQDLKALIPSDGLDPRYLLHALLANARRLEEQATGATVKGIKLDDLRKLKIPLLPLPEQKRIAGILDQADALLRLRARALEKLNTLGQAIFQEMFGNPGTNPKKWKIGAIGDLLSEVNYGTSAKANADGHGLPMLRMGNITYDGRLDLSDLKHIELRPRDVEKYTTKRGDILFNRTNSKELVGKTAVVKYDEPLAIAGYLVRARTNADGNADYISAYLNSCHGKATLMSMCKNIVGMANINAKEMQRIRIALPPRILQDQFSTRLEALEPLRKTMEISLTESAALFTSLQHRAFRGEL